LERTTFKLYPNSLFEDGTGPGLDPVGGEFQPSFETVHPGGGAHLIFVLHLNVKTSCPSCHVYAKFRMRTRGAMEGEAIFFNRLFVKILDKLVFKIERID
jgi:hypothetical protein